MPRGSAIQTQARGRFHRQVDAAGVVNGWADCTSGADAA
jgi:hypothetical protein